MMRIYQSTTEFIEVDSKREADEVRSALTFTLKKHKSELTMKMYDEIDKFVFEVPRYTHTLFDTKRDRLEIERDKFVSKKVKYPKFKLKLRAEQEKAVKQYFKHDDDNVLVLPPASGKTLLSINIASLLEEKAIILVHRSAFFNVWKKDMKTAFGWTDKELEENVGEIQGKKFRIGKLFTLATFQTLYSRDYDIYDKFGLVIGDECHHVPADTFSTVISQFKAKHMLGVTGTFERTDGLHKLTNLFMGRIAYMNEEADLEHVEVANIFRIDTNVPVSVRKGEHIHIMYRKLLANRDRYDLFMELFDVLKEHGRKQLVFTHSTSYAKLYCAMLNERGHRSMLSIGNNADRNAIAKQMMLDGKLDAIVATVQFLKEGESISNLDTIHVLTPISNKTDWLQSIARGQRQDPRKQKVLVLDYVDNMLPRCMRYLTNRLEWSSKANSHNYTLKPFTEKTLLTLT